MARMEVKVSQSLREFEAWSGAVDMKKTLIDLDLDEAFEDFINEIYPEGIDDTQLNDILWFEEEEFWTEYFGIVWDENGNASLKSDEEDEEDE